MGNITNDYTEVESFLDDKKKRFLTNEDYRKMCETENLTDAVKILDERGYFDGDISESSNPIRTIIQESKENLSAQINEMIKLSEDKPSLSKFLEYILHKYMILNFTKRLGMLKQGYGKNMFHPDPLGKFETLEQISDLKFFTFKEVYEKILLNSPIEIYFREREKKDQKKDIHEERFAYMFDDCTPEHIQTYLLSHHLEIFHDFCKSKNMDHISSSMMTEVLAFESDLLSITTARRLYRLDYKHRHDFNSTLSSKIGKLSEFYNHKTLRNDLMYTRTDKDLIGLLSETREDTNKKFSVYVEMLVRAEQVAPNKEFQTLVLEKFVSMGREAFLKRKYEDSLGLFGKIYFWIKLKEQEIKNVNWILECVKQNMKERIGEYIPIVEKEEDI